MFRINRSSSFLVALDFLYNRSITTLARSETLELVLPEMPAPDGCTYVLKSIQSALRHTSYLLALLAEISSTAAASHDTSSGFPGYVCWILDSLYRLREVEKALRPYSQWSSKLCILYFRAVHSLMSSLRSPDSIIRKGYYFLTHFCLGVLEFPEALPQVCSCLLDLAAASAQHEPIAQLVSTRLLPALLDLNPTNPDLQVGTLLENKRYTLTAIAMHCTLKARGVHSFR
jgi:hypothetical protein